MGSGKEEERNEKIIRGLMKLPPNRRCINCNSLGPQYVCTNFWTFVCTTCSGIHREFTHRVKSVSMSKFSSQEVEALQNGGNQRAREIYLKNWDPQGQRLPDSSKVEKVRDFIKIVYVDRRYAGGKTEKPPNDTQGLGSHEDETRRASSYHSYSQSPPYDYQYEDRRYGKQNAALTRKPGSDRGHYVGKISNFVYSPGRMSDQVFEDRFANEGSGSRVSDFSVSSGGDIFRSGTESPNFEKNMGFNSPPLQPSRDISSSMANFRRDVDGIPRPQRTTSLGSVGSFDSNSVSLKSYNSGSFLDVVSEPEQAAGAACHDKLSTVAQPSGPAYYGGLDLFQAPVVEESASSAAPIDLFQLPVTSSPANVFHVLQTSSAPSVKFHQPPQTAPKSLDFFDISDQSSTSTLDIKSQELSDPKNEGWATFDTPPTASIRGKESLSPPTVPVKGVPSVIFDLLSSFNTTSQRPANLNSGAHSPTPSSDLWLDGLNNVQAPTMAASTQSWNAFDDCAGNLSLEGVQQNFELQLAANQSSSTTDQNFSDSNDGGNQRAISQQGLQLMTVLSHADMGPVYTPSVLPLVGETQAHATDLKSINPFDFPYDSDLEQNNMFFDMSSLQAALPNSQLPSTFLGGATQLLFPQDPVTPFIPAVSQGGVVYLSGQAPTSQLPNVPAQGHVASVGGNPFA
ncbi:probable ADP-ribosylation factor GTPase-activating protein AGD14 isoform X2 [Mangifera indica]|uniref:probable ADP-ribosylation factor GTPase-activating protein AGD14 isoform X2 n=1 Tax=Mangifera indica TaxID=29780 RepID=UPI001CFB7E4E|nr:probable ADP-ribosylation factor GTPase-activating protein AGD14 isoform X2 [Mangifera indica]